MVNLLAEIGVRPDHLTPTPHLKQPHNHILEKVRNLINSDQGTKVGRLKIVFHPGSGRTEALWDDCKWARLADTLIEKHNATIVIAGGVKENQIAKDIASMMKHKSIDLSGRLTINEFICLSSMVDMVIGLESFAVHISAALDTPTLVIHGGIQDSKIFKPYGRKVLLVTKNTPCAPCWRTEGCAHMSCIRNIEVDDVMSEIQGGLHGHF
jgi:heptosyltransferase-2